MIQYLTLLFHSVQVEFRGIHSFLEVSFLKYPASVSPISRNERHCRNSCVIPSQTHFFVGGVRSASDNVEIRLISTVFDQNFNNFVFCLIHLFLIFGNNKLQLWQFFSRFSLDDKITLIDEIITIKRECNHYS